MFKLIFFFLAFFSFFASSDLVFRYEMVRHGHRTHIIDGKGYTDMDLTEKGKVESWALGQKRRQDLIIDQGFLNEELDVNEILVLSTNMDRTFNTAK
jgi:hypothetical protein